MKCSICSVPLPVDELNWETGKHDWDQGHNAKPVTDGRCCNDCNHLYVKPARIARRLQGLEAYEGSGVITMEDTKNA